MDLHSASDCHDYASEMAHVARRALKLPFATPDILIDAAASVLRRLYVAINDREAAFHYVLPRGIGATAFLAGVLPAWLALTDQRLPGIAVAVASPLEATFHRREVLAIIPALAQALYPYHTGWRREDVIYAAQGRLHVLPLGDFAATRWSANRYPSVVIFDGPRSFLDLPVGRGATGAQRLVAGDAVATVLDGAATSAHQRLGHVALAFGSDSTEGTVIGKGHLRPPLWISRYGDDGGILRRWWGAGVQPTPEEVTA